MSASAIMVMLVFSGFLTLLPAPVQAQSSLCGQTITSSTTLPSNVQCNGQGITLGANTITLDCNGYQIVGSGGGRGITVQAYTGDTVKNCKVSNFQMGIYVTSSGSGSQGTTITNNAANGNTFAGFYATGANGNSWAGNTASGNLWGFYFTGSAPVGNPQNTLTDNTATGNSNGGFGIYSGNSNILMSNTATSNTGPGFELSGDYQNTLTGNTASSNTGDGFLISRSGGGYLTLNSNTANGNGGNGFNVADSSNTNSFSSNSANNNAQYGYSDASTGSGTAGTGNTYTTNSCSGNTLGGSSPNGICSQASSVKISISFNHTPVPAGGNVRVVANLSGETSNAGGTVTYYWYWTGQEGSCTGQSTNAQVTVTNGVVPLSQSYGPLSPGAYSWQAVYSGDANNNAATSSCLSLTVTSPPSVSISPSTATIDADGVTSATFTAAPSGGSGTYSSYSWTFPSGLTASSGTCTSSSTTCKVTSTSTAGSPYTVSATATDSNGATSSAASATVTVNSALTAPTPPTVSATSLNAGQALTVTDSVPTTGTSPFSWLWLVSVNGGAYSTATQCATNSGTGASAGATETCSISANTLAAGSTYTFEFQVTDSLLATKTSTTSPTVIVSSSQVTQPFVATFNNVNGGSQQTITISGCSPSPSTFAGDGASHSITMSPSCTFTLSLPAGYQFVGGSGATTCSSGTCSTYSTSYEAVSTTITQPFIVSFNNVNGGSQQSITITGCNPSPQSFLGDGSSHSITMTSACTFALSLPPGYQFVGGSGSTTCASGTCSRYTTSYEASPPTTVTQPIIASFTNTYGGSQQTVTVSGCSPSPSTFPGDGASHSMTMSPSCSFTLSLPSGYQIIGGSGTTTCSSGTCNSYTTSYEATPPSSVTQPIAASFNNVNGGSQQTITVSGCNASPSSFLGDGSSHSITMTSACAFTLSLPVGYQFIGGAGTTTCTSGTCSGYTTSYEASPPTTVVQPITAAFVNTYSGSQQTVSVSGCSPTPSSFAGDGASHSLTMFPSCGFSLSLPSGYQFIGGSVSTTCSSGTCSTFSTSYEAVPSQVTQPLVATFNNVNGGSQQTVTITGCSPSPLTFTGDGTSHSIIMSPSCTFTLSLPSGYQFTGGSGTTTCSSGTCTTYSTGYKAAPSQVTQQITISFASSAPTTTFTISGCSPSPPSLGSGTTNVMMAPNCQFSINAPVVGSTSRYVFSNGGTSISETTCSSGTCQTISLIVTYQYAESVSYSILDGGSPTAAPNLAYFSLGILTTYTMTTSSVTEWIDYATSWSISPNPLTGSSSTERWEASGGLAGSTTAGGTIDPLYYHQYSQSVSYFQSCASGATCPPPALSYTNYGSSLPSTLSTSAQTYWMDSGSTASVPPSITDLQGNAYNTSPNSWQITGTDVVPSQIVYTILNTKVTVPIALASSPSNAPVATFAISGCNVSPTTIIGDGQTHYATASPNCPISVTAPPAGSNTRFVFSGGASYTTITACGLSSSPCPLVSKAYFYQFEMVASYSIIAGGAPTAPTLTYVSYGAAAPALLVTSPVPVWMDFGSSWSISANPLSSSSSIERWETNNQLTGSAVAGGGIDPLYYHQFIQGVSYTLTCAPVATCPNVKISYTTFGSTTSSTLTSTSQAVWMDAGSTASVPETLSDSMQNTYSTPTYFWTIAGPNAIPIPIPYAQVITVAAVELDSSPETFTNNIPQTVITVTVLGSNNAPLASVTLSVSTDTGTLASQQIVTNNQGKQTVTLTLASPINSPVTATVTAIATNGIGNKISIKFKPPSFLINEKDQTGSYSIYFSVDWSKYQLLTAQDAGSSQLYLPQAQYLFYYVQNPANYPIYLVQVFQDNPPSTSPLPASSSTTQLVYETLVWAYNYAQTGTLNSNFGQNSGLYQSALIAYNNEWKQETGIVLANALNYATIIGPLLPSIQSYLGSDSSQGQKLVQLMWAITQGYQQLSSTLGDSAKANQVLAVLEEPQYGLVSGQGYTGAQFLTNLAELSPNQDTSLIASLMSAAYGVTSVAPSVQTFGANVITNLVSAAVSLGAQASVASLETFTGAYFAYGLTLQTSGGAATTAFVDTVDAGSAEFTGFAIPSAIASAIVQSYLMPMSSMLQEQVNIQNLQVQTLYPAFFSEMNNLVTSDNFANLPNGLAVLPTEGLIASTTAAWSSIDHSVTQSEFLYNIFWSSQAQSQMQTDNTNAMTFSQFAYNLVQAQRGMQTQAQSLVNNQDPAGIPSPLALTLPNQNVKPLVSSFPSGNVLAFFANGSGRTTLSFGNYSIRVGDNMIQSSYQYALGGWAGNSSGIVVFGSPSGSFALAPTAGNANVASYSIDSSGRTLLTSGNLSTNETALFGVTSSGAGRVSAVFGNYAVIFVEHGLTNEVWGVDINNTIIQSETNTLKITGLTSPTLRFSVYSPPGYTASPSTSQVSLSTSPNTVQVSFATTPWLPFWLVAVTGVVLGAVLVISYWWFKGRGRSPAQGLVLAKTGGL